MRPRLPPPSSAGVRKSPLSCLLYASLELLEESVRQIGALTTSVEKLARAVEAMGRTLSAQGNRLETLEGRDGKRWRQLMGYVLTAVVSVLVGFAATRLGLT